jgi:hypothetical protein
MASYLLKKWTAVTLLITAISGCGGGGGGGTTTNNANGSSNTTPTGTGNTLGTAANEAEGYYEGTLSNGNKITAIVLGDGALWLTLLNSTDALSNVIQGTGTVQGGSFSSTNAKDFAVLSKDAPTAATVSASYTPKSAFSGTFAESSRTLSFSTTYNGDYDIAIPLATLAGNYSGVFVVQGSQQLVAGISFNLTINSTGAINGTMTPASTVGAPCNFQGSMTQTAPSKNPYRFSISISEASCVVQSSTITGIIAPNITQGSTQKLTVLGVSQDRSKVFVSGVSKPK